MMFNPKERFERLGNVVTENESLNILEPVEAFFLDVIKERPFEVSHDCSAHEPMYFKTLNYTNYAGCFVIHPLQPEISLRQTYDASRENCKIKNFSDFFADRTLNLDPNKYQEIKSEPLQKVSALVVLMGGNKIYHHLCANKVNHIIELYGKEAVFKPHPLTTPEVMTSLRSKFPKINLLAPTDDLFPYLKRVDIIYTSHLSETACYASSIGKAISPVDSVQTRVSASFNHINYHLFMENDKKDFIDKSFSSSRSGIIHPEIDLDWQDKIIQYLDYIQDFRERLKGHYV